MRYFVRGDQAVMGLGLVLSLYLEHFLWKYHGGVHELFYLMHRFYLLGFVFYQLRVAVFEFYQSRVRFLFYLLHSHLTFLTIWLPAHLLLLLFLTLLNYFYLMQSNWLPAHFLLLLFLTLLNYFYLMRSNWVPAQFLLFCVGLK